VSSLVHRIGKIRFDDLQGERGYQKWLAYGQSKLAGLVFSHELARRLAARGLAVSSVACHPGYSATNLQLAGARMTRSPLAEALWKGWNALAAQPAELGALPTLYAATAPDVRGGDYIGPGGILELRGHPKKVSSSTLSRDPELARRLWEASERLTGVRYDAMLG
jgi:NAD(P)-dependent dehydrogenase (short-subunit alcohol dehydrogenase family)